MVHPRYMQYIGWSFASNTLVSIELSLSTYSMLAAVGKESSQVIMSSNYIGKDIVGQLGGLWHMNKFGKKADQEPSKFLNYSMGMQQTSIMLECITPFLPTWAFVGVAGFANVGQNIAATGIGAVNARVIKDLAHEENIGEIYAKASVFNTLGSSIGMGIGIGITALISDDMYRLAIIPVLSILRIYTYRKAVECLV